ncbi:MAG: VWA domain-containing protein [Anaerolinea sp.]|nr:VWA domain-containing protein [Anaerolinea sp.]
MTERRIVNRWSSDSSLVHRLVACMPAATYEMETLCRLAGIQETRSIPTAAVECVQCPRLLLNPDFVARHCQRDEHLFLLVMHELWHVILAHTRLYPRATLAHNIAFDAIINAGLARQFNAPEFRGFFEALNPADSFPGCLLRPPEGWPANPIYLEHVGPPGTKGILQRLYPPADLHRWSTPLYQEILDLLAKWIKQQPEGIPVPVLLGNHSAQGNSTAGDDDALQEVLRRVTKNWPPPPFAQAGSGDRGEGFNLEDWQIGRRRPGIETRRVFARVLRRYLEKRSGTFERRSHNLQPGIGGLHVLPNPRDRTAQAREQLGVKGLLWNSPVLVRMRTYDSPAHAHIYLDVSGSMTQVLPELIDLLLPYVRIGQAHVFQFSNKVEPLTHDQIKAGRLRSTQGTDINCLLRHLADQHRVRRALIVTDGHVGRPTDDVQQLFRERRLTLYAAVTGESGYTRDLEGLVQGIVVLPPVCGG